MLTALIVATVVGQPTVDLVSHSKAITSVKTWLHLMDLPPVHDWLDNEHIAYPINEPGGDLRFQILDVRSGKSEVAGFSNAFNQSLGNVLDVYYSPNGKEVLWGGDHQWHITQVDGANHREFDQQKKTGDDTEVVLRWAPDGKSVIEWRFEQYLTGKTQCWQRSAIDVANVKELPKPKHDLTWMPEIRPGGKVTTTEDVLMGPEKRSQHFVTWNFEKPNAVRKYTVKVPSNRTVSCFRISPDGKSILWDLSIYKNGQVKAWAGNGDEFWVSDIEGKNWRYQATIRYSGKNAESDERSMGLPRWRPDQRAFSYTYQDRLYQFTLR